MIHAKKNIFRAANLFFKSFFDRLNSENETGGKIITVQIKSHSIGSAAK